MGEETLGEIKLYPTRWIQIALFCIISMSNAMLWITFAPIANLAETFYDVPSYAINSLSVVYMVMYIPMVFPAGLYLDNQIPKIPGGLKWGLIIGIAGSAVSAIVRALSNEFWLVWIGQFIGATVQPFILNAPPMLAANWFPSSQRTMATTVCSVSNPIGVALGFIIPPLVVSEDNLRFQLLMVIQAVMVTVVCIISVILLREKPPTPPSISSGMGGREDEKMLRTLKILFTDINFWIITVSFGCGLGAFNTLATLLNSIVSFYGFGDDATGAFGATVVIMGLVGSGIGGAVVDKFHCYKLAITICFLTATVALLVFTFTLTLENFWVTFFACSGVGFTMTPILPLCLELAVEIVYPLKEATPSGVLMSAGQLVGVVLIFEMDYLISIDKVEAANITVCISACIALIVILFFRGKLKRLNVATEQVPVNQ